MVFRSYSILSIDMAFWIPSLSRARGPAKKEKQGRASALPRSAVASKPRAEQLFLPLDTAREAPAVDNRPKRIDELTAAEIMALRRKQAATEKGNGHDASPFPWEVQA